MCIRDRPGIDLRWKHKVTAVTPQGAGAMVEVDTPHGRFPLQADWLVVADGARSPIPVSYTHLDVYKRQGPGR